MIKPTGTSISYLCTMHTASVIVVKNKVGSNPNYRDSAELLFTDVPGTAQELVLDFSDVEFVSRGFADELHKARLRYQAEHQVAVVLENVNGTVQQMLSAVARTQSGKSTLEIAIPVIRVKNVEELERMLLGC